MAVSSSTLTATAAPTGEAPEPLSPAQAPLSADSKTPTAASQASTATTTPTLPARAESNEPFPSPSGAFVPAPQCEGQLSSAWANGLPPAPPGHGASTSKAGTNLAAVSTDSIARPTSSRRTSSSQPPTRPPSLPASEVTLDAIIAASASSSSSRPASRRSSAFSNAMDGLSLAASPKGLRPLSTSGLGRDPSRLSIGSRSGKGSNAHSPADNASSPLGLGRSDSKRSSAGRRASSSTMQRQSSNGVTSSSGAQQTIAEGIAESRNQPGADKEQGASQLGVTSSGSLAELSEDGQSQAGGAFTPLGKSSLSRATSTTSRAPGTSTSQVKAEPTAAAAENELPEVKIRDFGFPDSDPRYLGIRPPGAEPERGRAGEDGDDDDDDGFRGFSGARGAGGFKGGAAFGLGGGAGGAAAGGWRVVHGAGGDEGDEGGDGAELGHAEEWQIDGVEEDEEYDEEEHGQQSQEGLPLGLYRAAYAFEAESEHELSVEVGAVVDVVGALEGGWAIAVLHTPAAEGGGGEKQEEEEPKRGLVPESYLEWIGGDEGATGAAAAGEQ